MRRAGESFNIFAGGGDLLTQRYTKLFLTLLH